VAIAQGVFRLLDPIKRILDENYDAQQIINLIYEMGGSSCYHSFIEKSSERLDIKKEEIKSIIRWLHFVGICYHNKTLDQLFLRCDTYVSFNKA